MSIDPALLTDDGRLKTQPPPPRRAQRARSPEAVSASVMAEIASAWRARRPGPSPRREAIDTRAPLEMVGFTDRDDALDAAAYQAPAIMTTTEHFAARLAEDIRPGDVVRLSGEPNPFFWDEPLTPAAPPPTHFRLRARTNNVAITFERVGRSLNGRQIQDNEVVFHERGYYFLLSPQDAFYRLPASEQQSMQYTAVTHLLRGLEDSPAGQVPRVLGWNVRQWCHLYATLRSEGLRRQFREMRVYDAVAALAMLQAAWRSDNPRSDRTPREHVVGIAHEIVETFNAALARA